MHVVEKRKRTKENVSVIWMKVSKLMDKIEVYGYINWQLFLLIDFSNYWWFWSVKNESKYNV